jgi:hypothetical protein
MSMPNSDGVPVTRQSVTAKTEAGVKVSAAIARIIRMPISCELEAHQMDYLLQQ